MQLRRRTALATASAVLVLTFVMSEGVQAQEAPSATATPSVALSDGQTISVTASGFTAASGGGITIVPTASQCPAGLLPVSAVFPFDPSTAEALSQLLRESCAFLGTFPPEGSPTTREVVVRTTVTTGTGATFRCGLSAGDCVIAVGGITTSLQIGIATTPISFAPTAPTAKAQCKFGGWRNLADVQGRAFRNQGQCVAFVVARRG